MLGGQLVWAGARAFRGGMWDGERCWVGGSCDVAVTPCDVRRLETTTMNGTTVVEALLLLCLG